MGIITIKRAFYMGKSLWIRLGDHSDYEQINGLEEAAELLTGVSGELVKVSYYGVTDNCKFSDYNYVSLYYGDENAQPLEPISGIDLAVLNGIISEKLLTN